MGLEFWLGLAPSLVRLTLLARLGLRNYKIEALRPAGSRLFEIRVFGAAWLVVI